MADFLRFQVAGWTASELPINAVVNTLHFRRNGPDMEGGGSDQALVDDLWTIFNNATWLFAGCDRLSVKAYDLEDMVGGVAGGNPPIAKKEAPCAPRAEPGVREVAICLSYRGEANTPRTRGRIFCGPLSNAWTNKPRPEAAQITPPLDLATALGNLGGVDVDWCVYSPTTRAGSPGMGDSMVPVKLAWVDNAWDTQRRRGLRPLARTTRAMDE